VRSIVNIQEQFSKIVSPLEILNLSDEELDRLLCLADTMDDQVNAVDQTRLMSTKRIKGKPELSILILGSSGNRYGALTGFCGGLWIVVDGHNLLIDPGPSFVSLVNQVASSGELNEYLKFEHLDAILCSHLHQDHSSNLVTVIEGMTLGMKREGGYIVGNPTVMCGFSKLDPYYFRNSKSVILHPLGRAFFDKYPKIQCNIETESSISLGDLKLIATPTKHKEIHECDDSGVGFFIQSEKFNLWYTSDTMLFPELLNYVKDLSSEDKKLIVIANAGGVHKFAKSLQLRTSDLEQIALKLEPSYILINHYDIAYSAPQFRVGQANLVQRALNYAGVNITILPTSNGFLFRWVDPKNLSIHKLITDPGLDFVYDYCSLVTKQV
jgi:phosphoribosyl 1,2-cyclic phosphodiesterase